ncbi:MULTISPECIES: hypothetical protein [Streptacidiphilus]|uniref:Uncharacterized protein n=1 Tax=Streptacidiphilus cavernicola TaxID=3342716 RepID=A0ABV6UWD3_9ACTN|nr:hypothetical protein [Streptacidiphilus jeojiense]
MATEQPTPVCQRAHYTLAAQCTLLPGHDGTWHQALHPDDGRLLRFRVTADVQQTQEWEPNDDPGATNPGEWITLHYATAQTRFTTVVPDDLDQRGASLISGHFETGRTRETDTGTGTECACGTWYPASPYGAHSKHLGREISLLVRSYFDTGLHYGKAS